MTEQRGIRSPVADVIHDFLDSGEPGIEVSFTGGAVKRAAEKMFTAKGLTCPIAVYNMRGTTYIIRRDAI